MAPLVVEASIFSDAWNTARNVGGFVADKTKDVGGFVRDTAVDFGTFVGDTAGHVFGKVKGTFKNAMELLKSAHGVFEKAVVKHGNIAMKDFARYLNAEFEKIKHCTDPDLIKISMCGADPENLMEKVSMCFLTEVCPHEYSKQLLNFIIFQYFRRKTKLIISEEINQCCTHHDACYLCSHGKTKVMCDLDFQNCMDRSARTLSCKATTSLFYKIVHNFPEAWHGGNRCGDK